MDADNPLSWSTLLILFNTLCYNYVFCAAILFVCLGWVAKDILKILSRRIKHYDRLSIDDSTLDRWRRQYLLICQLVDKLNESFGILLVILTSTGFVRMVSSSFHLVIQLTTLDWNERAYRLYFGALEIGYVFFIAQVAHRIRQEVTDISSLSVASWPL